MLATNNQHIRANACVCRIRKALENRTNMEDDRVAILEAQLSQAKLIAEEADKKYEEVDTQFLSSITHAHQIHNNSQGLIG